MVNTWKLKGQLDATEWFLYCKTYCSLNMFRAPLYPSSGAQELHRWLLPLVLVAEPSFSTGYRPSLLHLQNRNSRETPRKPDT